MKHGVLKKQQTDTVLGFDFWFLFNQPIIHNYLPQDPLKISNKRPRYCLNNFFYVSALGLNSI